MKRLDVKDYIIKNGGATLDGCLDVVSFKKGYQVAFKEYEYISNNIEDVLDMVEDYAIMCNGSKNKYVGVWCNQEDGYYYLDVSCHINNKALALEIGEQEKQLSIFEWATCDCIDL